MAKKQVVQKKLSEEFKDYYVDCLVPITDYFDFDKEDWKGLYILVAKKIGDLTREGKYAFLGERHEV